MKNFHTKDYLYIDTVTLMVKDINKQLEFYTKVLGLTLLKQEDNNYFLGTEKRTLIILNHNEEAILKERTTGLYHLALLLPNSRYLGQFIKHLIKLNVKVVGGADHDVSEAMYLSDPEGNGIEIYSDREAFEWEYNNKGEILMGTEQIDYETLVINAYKEEWVKMPEDTIMGHVHFHVNNMDTAKAFFIDTLGFQPTLKYGPSALFLSDQKYHHHVGMNLWNGIDAINRPYDMVGLVSYTLNVPEKEFANFNARIENSEYEVRSDDFGKFITDINDVKVYF